MKRKRVLMVFIFIVVFSFIFLVYKESIKNEDLLEEAIEFYEQKDYIDASNKLNEITVSSDEVEKWKEKVAEKILKEYVQYKLLYGDLK